MRLKKFLGATKKSGESGYFYTERKIVENRTDSAVTEPKIGPTPDVLAYSKSPCTGGNMHI